MSGLFATEPEHRPIAQTVLNQVFAVTATDLISLLYTFAALPHAQRAP
jgi:hypothetical protein